MKWAAKSRGRQPFSACETVFGRIAAVHISGPGLGIVHGKTGPAMFQFTYRERNHAEQFQQSHPAGFLFLAILLFVGIDFRWISGIFVSRHQPANVLKGQIKIGPGNPF